MMYTKYNININVLWSISMRYITILKTTANVHLNVKKLAIGHTCNNAIVLSQNMHLGQYC